MAGGAKPKNGLLDDLVPTISDDEASIPDLDGIETHSESGDASELQAGRKRKRNANGSLSVLEGSQSKKQRKGKKDQEIDTQSDQDEENDWARQGEDSGAINPDFTFDIEDDTNGVVQGFDDGWVIGADKELGGEMPKRGLSVEQIIQKRRDQAKAQEESIAKLNGASGSYEDAEESGGDFAGVGNGEDEMLADDIFGAGAPQDNDENGEEHETDEEEDVASAIDDIRDDFEVNGYTENHESGEDDEMASPVPHPDDLANISDASNEENEDPEEKIKRDAFFAPEEISNNTKNLLKTEASFQSMSLSRPILKGLAAVGFTSPTPIQTKTVPVALLGKDVVGGAVTGSGKTAAFILPILERLLYRPKKIATTRVGILMPTRELAVQCFNVATKLASFTDITFALVVGGLSLREQEQTLKKRPDVVIATPGRFIDHMRNSASFAVENLEILVLDEADRMLEDGFADELNEVLSTIPRSRQTMLFSATMTQDVDKLIRAGLTKPVRLMLDPAAHTVSGLVQEFIKLKGAPQHSTEPESQEITDLRRQAYLLHLCTRIYIAKTIVFLPTKQLAHRLRVLFALEGLRAVELHGSMSQEQRLAAISAFREGRASHLLATDLASRGLDIPRVETVVNFSVPGTATGYLHRVGRTARAGRAGVACTLFSGVKASGKEGKGKGGGAPASERALLRPILRLARGQGVEIRTRNLPGEAVAVLLKRVRGCQEEIDGILREEKEERAAAQAERDIVKGENLVRFEDEIRQRPRRTWFQSEKEKMASKEAGRDERMGVRHGAGGEGMAGRVKEKKRKLSGKDRKRLRDRDERKEGGGPGWKKGRAERVGKVGRSARGGAKAGGKGKRSRR